eukprot:363336-Chlamydomonas_euryale.AAC.6
MAVHGTASHLCMAVLAAAGCCCVALHAAAWSCCMTWYVAAWRRGMELHVLIQGAKRTSLVNILVAQLISLILFGTPTQVWRVVHRVSHHAIHAASMK